MEHGDAGAGAARGHPVALGLVFVSTLAIVNRMVPDDRRSGLLAVFFTLLFLANSLPVVAIGFIADLAGLPAAVTGFAVGVIIVVLVLPFCLLGHRGVVDGGRGGPPFARGQQGKPPHRKGFKLVRSRGISGDPENEWRVGPQPPTRPAR